MGLSPHIRVYARTEGHGDDRMASDAFDRVVSTEAVPPALVRTVAAARVAPAGLDAALIEHPRTPKTLWTRIGWQQQIDAQAARTLEFVGEAARSFARYAHPSTDARLLRPIREAYGWSQARLANRIGVSQGTVSKWECGKSEMELSRLAAVAGALVMSESALLAALSSDEGD